ncbi:DUF1659 domain-containing protein [Bacillus carboniphilus]|uniref:DUF1659 domain-containing protein n=1 Tax=Bacillus carboniphilus TaxID=86663 RepID=A0ABY9JUU9_9BACI|nr:DUF1659 domain-containing protein [Bacillus carboniphilus]WLR43166.1 DUF1659 domain-containing protein [Bacillus carboniphilus]
MANSTITSSQLRLIFEEGLDEQGKTVFSYKSYNNVKAEATAEQLFAVANKLVSLQTKPLFEVERNDSSLIEE